MMVFKKHIRHGQRWWLSWLSSRFRHQRSAVRIPTLAKFYLPIVNWNRKKAKLNKKRWGMAHLGKRNPFEIFTNYLQVCFTFKIGSLAQRVFKTSQSIAAQWYEWKYWLKFNRSWCRCLQIGKLSLKTDTIIQLQLQKFLILQLDAKQLLLLKLERGWKKNNWDTQKNFVWNLFDVQEWKKRLICKKEELQMFAIYFFSHSAAT